MVVRLVVWMVLRLRVVLIVLVVRSNDSDGRRSVGILVIENNE